MMGFDDSLLVIVCFGQSSIPDLIGKSHPLKLLTYIPKNYCIAIAVAYY